MAKLFSELLCELCSEKFVSGHIYTDSSLGFSMFTARGRLRRLGRQLKWLSQHHENQRNETKKRAKPVRKKHGQFAGKITILTVVTTPTSGVYTYVWAGTMRMMHPAGAGRVGFERRLKASNSSKLILDRDICKLLYIFSNYTQGISSRQNTGLTWISHGL